MERKTLWCSRICKRNCRTKSNKNPSQEEKQREEGSEERGGEKKLCTNEISCKALGDFLLQNGNPGKQARARAGAEVKASLVRSEAEEKSNNVSGKIESQQPRAE